MSNFHRNHSSSLPALVFATVFIAYFLVFSFCTALWARPSWRTSSLAVLSPADKYLQENISASIHEKILNARTLADRGVIRSDKTLLLKACADFEQIVSLTRSTLMQTPTTETEQLYVYALYYLVFVQHWLALHGRGKNDDALFTLYLPKAITNAEMLIRLRPDWAEGHLLLSTMYGLKLSTQLTLLFSLGPAIERHVQRAAELSPNNPRVLYVQASAYYIKPGIVGGNIKKAVEYWRRAAQIFEQERSDTKRRRSLEPSWGYVETLAGLGRALEEQGEMQEARAVFRQALSIEPEYVWVKEELLPNLEGRIQRSR
jgi:tetratricopeptide (TPR) repeat protein